jgi:hypothetical protein
MKLAATCCLCLCGAIPAQQVWKVSCSGGPGVHFTDLPQAVAAAAPNDEVWVYNSANCVGGNYYTAPIITKPLRIIGFNTLGGAPNHPSGVDMRGIMVISGISAGEQVVVSNLSLAPGSDPGAIVGLDCAGQLLLEDVGFVSSGFRDAYVHFERCADVTLRGCEMILGGSPIRVIDSTALLSWCSVYPWPPGGVWPPLLSYQQTAESLRITNSTVSLVGTLILGQGVYLYNPWWRWVARPAVHVESGTLRLGPASTLRGGPDFSVSGYEISYLVDDPNTGVVEQDSRAVVDKHPSSSLPWHAVPRDRSAVYLPWMVAGQSYQIFALGPINGFAALMFGDLAPQATPTPWGSLAIDPLNAQLVDIVPLSGQYGQYEWNGPVPATMAVAHAVAFQALMLAPDGSLELSIPSPFAVGWPHGVTP